MSAQLAVIFIRGTLGFEQWTDWVGLVGGWFDHPFFSSLPFSTRPEQTGADPNPGLNPLHQFDLRKKHSSIPERRRHISRSSGNRGRLMKCRLALLRQRGVRSGSQAKPWRSCAPPIKSCFTRAFATRFWRRFQNHVSKMRASCRRNHRL